MTDATTPADGSAPTTPAPAAPAPAQITQILQGYSFEGPALEFGAAVVDGLAYPEAKVRIPLAVLNRHGLVAGATGTGRPRPSS